MVGRFDGAADDRKGDVGEHSLAVVRECLSGRNVLEYAGKGVPRSPVLLDALDHLSAQDKHTVQPLLDKFYQCVLSTLDSSDKDEAAQAFKLTTQLLYDQLYQQFGLDFHRVVKALCRSLDGCDQLDLIASKLACFDNGEGLWKSEMKNSEGAAIANCVSNAFEKCSRWIFEEGPNGIEIHTKHPEPDLLTISGALSRIVTQFPNEACSHASCWVPSVVAMLLHNDEQVRHSARNILFSMQTSVRNIEAVNEKMLKIFQSSLTRLGAMFTSVEQKLEAISAIGWFFVLLGKDIKSVIQYAAPIDQMFGFTTKLKKGRKKMDACNFLVKCVSKALKTTVPEIICALMDAWLGMCFNFSRDPKKYSTEKYISVFVKPLNHLLTHEMNPKVLIKAINVWIKIATWSRENISVPVVYDSVVVQLLNTSLGRYLQGGEKDVQFKETIFPVILDHFSEFFKSNSWKTPSVETQDCIDLESWCRDRDEVQRPKDAILTRGQILTAYYKMVQASIRNPNLITRDCFRKLWASIITSVPVHLLPDKTSAIKPQIVFETFQRMVTKLLQTPNGIVENCVMDTWFRKRETSQSEEHVPPVLKALELTLGATNAQFYFGDAAHENEVVLSRYTLLWMESIAKCKELKGLLFSESISLLVSGVKIILETYRTKCADHSLCGLVATNITNLLKAGSSFIHALSCDDTKEWCRAKLLWSFLTYVGSHIRDSVSGLRTRDKESKGLLNNHRVLLRVWESVVIRALLHPISVNASYDKFSGEHRKEWTSLWDIFSNVVTHDTELRGSVLPKAVEQSRSLVRGIHNILLEAAEPNKEDSSPISRDRLPWILMMMFKALEIEKASQFSDSQRRDILISRRSQYKLNTKQGERRKFTHLQIVCYKILVQLSKGEHTSHTPLVCKFLAYLQTIVSIVQDCEKAWNWFLSLGPSCCTFLEKQEIDLHCTNEAETGIENEVSKRIVTLWRAIANLVSTKVIGCKFDQETLQEATLDPKLTLEDMLRRAFMSKAMSPPVVSMWNAKFAKEFPATKFERPWCMKMHSLFYKKLKNRGKDENLGLIPALTEISTALKNENKDSKTLQPPIPFNSKKNFRKSLGMSVYASGETLLSTGSSSMFSGATMASTPASDPAKRSPARPSFPKAKILPESKSSSLANATESSTKPAQKAEDPDASNFAVAKSPFNTNPDFVKKKRNLQTKFVEVSNKEECPSTPTRGMKRPRKRNRLHLYNPIDEHSSLLSVSPNTTPSSAKRSKDPLRSLDPKTLVTELSPERTSDTGATKVNDNYNLCQEDKNMQGQLSTRMETAPPNPTNLTTQMLSAVPQVQNPNVAEQKDQIFEMKKEMNKIWTHLNEMSRKLESITTRDIGGQGGLAVSELRAEIEVLRKQNESLKNENKSLKDEVINCYRKLELARGRPASGSECDKTI